MDTDEFENTKMDLTAQQQFTEQRSYNQLSSVPKIGLRKQPDMESLNGESRYQYQLKGPPKVIPGDIINDDEGNDLQQMNRVTPRKQEDKSIKSMKVKNSTKRGDKNKEIIIQTQLPQAEASISMGGIGVAEKYSMQYNSYRMQNEFKNFKQEEKEIIQKILFEKRQKALNQYTGELQHDENVVKIEYRYPQAFDKKSLFLRQFICFLQMLNTVVASFCFGFYLTHYNSVGEVIQQINGWTDEYWAYTQLYINSAFAAGCILSTIVMRTALPQIFKDLRRFFIILDFYTVVVGLNMIYSYNRASLIISQFLIGFIMGLNFNAIPTYLREISHLILPKFFQGMFYLSISLGIFISIATGLALGQEPTMDDVERRRPHLETPVWFCGLRALFWILIAQRDISKLRLDEHSTCQLTQYYEHDFYTKNHHLITMKEICEEEFDENIDRQRKEAAVNVTSRPGIFNPFASSYQRREVLAAIMGIGGQLTGYYMYMMYNQRIFYDNLNLNRMDAYGLSGALSCAAFVAHFLSLIILKFTPIRDKVFLVGIIILIISNFIIVGFGMAMSRLGYFWSLGCFISGYWISYGYLENQYIDEILDFKAKNTFYLWKFIGLFIISLSTSPMLMTLGLPRVATILGAISILLAVYVFFEVKDTSEITTFKCMMLYVSKSNMPPVNDDVPKDFGEYNPQYYYPHIMTTKQLEMLQSLQQAGIGFPMDKHRIL